MAKLLDSSRKSLLDACARLRGGHLVAFPTETVYGLGANALDFKAVEGIFRAKGRPHTDPLIVHVASVEQGLRLCRLSDAEAALFRALARRFWPGPLTLVVPSTDAVPKNVRAGGPTLGLRCPDHPLALELLRALAPVGMDDVGVPIAAPSANRFGHVSPTSAAHVLSDFPEDDVAVLDGGQCRVGIESTVVALFANELRILRRGGVSEAELNAFVVEGGLHSVRVVACEQFTPVPAGVDPDVVMESPGQLLTHYAPDMPALLVAHVGKNAEKGAAAGARFRLESCVVLDFGGFLAMQFADASRGRQLSAECLDYADLSKQGNPSAAAASLFARLRAAESYEGAAALALADLSLVAHVPARSGVSRLALNDRARRATSGRRGGILWSEDEASWMLAEL